MGTVFAQNVKLPPMNQLTENDTFRAARLTPSEQQQAFDEIEPISFDAPSSWESELRARRVSLGSLKEGLILQGSDKL